jgi:outer membrane protein assembly factor BamD (BamD/ComL family)
VAEAKSEWYIPGRDRKPAGPYTTEQVLRALRIGRVTRQTICWREGMAEWLPIEQIPAIAHLLQPAQAQRGLIRFRCGCGNEIVMSHKFSGKQAKCSGCGAIVTVPAVVGDETAEVPKPKRSFVPKLIILLVLAGLGAGAYFFVVADYLKLNKAKDLIEKGSYSKASRELRGLEKSFLFKNQAQYLDGLIEVYEFASSEETHEISVAQILQEGNPLSGAERSLKKACKAEPKCNELAKNDLAKAVEEIPAETSDRLARILAINLLRKELDAADSKQLAQEVIKALRSNLDFQQRFPDYKSLVTLLLNWDPSLMSDLLTAILPEDAAATLLYFRNLRTIYNWAQEKPELQSAYPDAILTSVKKILDSDRPQDAVGILDNSLEYLPEEKKPAAADLYWQAAKLLKEKNPNLALRAFESALKLQPDIAQTESDALLGIELSSKADEKKLAQYQLFLSKYPESSDRARVLSMLVVDATTVGNQQSYFQRTPVAPYLDAASPAATELLDKYLQTPQLDSILHNFARSLHKNKRQGEALDLAKNVLEKFPETSMKFEIEQDMAQWSRAEYGTLPVSLHTLEEQVNKQLKILTLSAPGVVRILRSDPKTYHVAEVNWNCTKEKFNSEEVQILKDWVANGGVLWGTNNILDVFEIKYAWGRFALWVNWRNVHQCQPGIMAQSCPLLSGCSQVVLRLKNFPAANLDHPNVIPLLTSQGVTSWSLVRYGNGWISDVKPVDLNQYDGARFWLNFRLFCLGKGREIPDAPSGSYDNMMKLFGRSSSNDSIPKPPIPDPGAIKPDKTPFQPSKTDEPTIVAGTNELDAALAEALKNPQAHKVLWIKLSQRDLSRAQQQTLKDWVAQGGVVWLESDLVKVFAFPGLISVPPGIMKGETFVFPAKHPLTQGAEGTRFQYEMVSGQVAVRIPSRFQAPKGDVKPLLVIEPTFNQFLAIGAFKAHQKGYVILRPAKIMTDTQPGQKFDQNLRTFSFNPTQKEPVTGYHPVL